MIDDHIRKCIVFFIELPSILKSLSSGSQSCFYIKKEDMPQ